MSQARVTDFFSTRKRARQEDATLVKEKRLKSVEAPVVRSTRSAAKKGLVKESVVESEARSKEPEQLLSDTTNKQQEQPVAEKPKQKLTAAELKAKMQNFSSKLQKHKEKYAAKEKELAAEVPVQSLNKIQSEINKICSKEATEETEEAVQPTPAYAKYANLASVDIEQKLVLPNKYQTLFELFKGTDTVVKFIHNRQEVCTFLKLKQSVQNMTKKNFAQSNLGQMKTVYSTAYIFKQEKIFIDFKNDYHLTIEPNFEKEVAVNENGLRIVSPLMLLERLQRFKTRLFDVVKDVHQKFLKSIGVTIETRDIKRWHPKFDLEEIEEIVSSELPQRPNEIKVKTGEDLKNIAKEVYSNRVKTAIDLVLQQQQEIVKAVAVAPAETQTEQSTLKEKQKSNYTALLERVRAKERHKDIENMVINSDKEKRLQMLEKYTECIRFVKSYFLSEKKATIDLDTVCKKMHESIRAHTANECEELLRELCKDFSNWISVIKVRQQQYVKIDKAIEVNELLTKVTSMIESVKA